MKKIIVLFAILNVACGTTNQLRKPQPIIDRTSYLSGNARILDYPDGKCELTIGVRDGYQLKLDPGEWFCDKAEYWNTIEAIFKSITPVKPEPIKP